MRGAASRDTCRESLPTPPSRRVSLSPARAQPLIIPVVRGTDVGFFLDFFNEMPLWLCVWVSTCGRRATRPSQRGSCAASPPSWRADVYSRGVTARVGSSPRLPFRLMRTNRNAPSFSVPPLCQLLSTLVRVVVALGMGWGDSYISPPPPLYCTRCCSLDVLDECQVHEPGHVPRRPSANAVLRACESQWRPNVLPPLSHLSVTVANDPEAVFPVTGAAPRVPPKSSRAPAPPVADRT